MSKVRPISGFPEWLPSERIIEQHFLDVIRETFELHGFASIETRAVEPIERLSSQGEDTDKEIYAISRLAAGNENPAASSRDPRLGLHFDLTVPFARYVLENAGKLTFPFRRYQIQPVWRGERPQEGRYREFTQCDIDIVDVGSLPPHYEAELPLVVADAFSKLPIGPFRIQVNNRKIPQGFYVGIGIGSADVQTMLRIVDKLDKIGPERVLALMVAAGATAEQARAALALAQISAPDESFVERVQALGVEHETLTEGLAELAAVMRVGAQHANGLMVADLKVARGLDYYTGTVYETQLIGSESYGSICSGGRYDALASDGRSTYPGVGISIGLSRLLAKIMPTLSASRSTPSCVLVALGDESDRAHGMAVAAALRRRRIACEVSPVAAKFGKQIMFAQRRGIPFVWFPATGEQGGQPAKDSVKDIRSGAQTEADPAQWMPPAEDLRPQVLA